jgi:hypothetical protein
MIDTEKYQPARQMLNFSFNGDVRWVFFITNIKVGNSPVFVYQCRSVLENIKVTTSLMT